MTNFIARMLLQTAINMAQTNSGEEGEPIENSIEQRDDSSEGDEHVNPSSS